MAAAPFRVVILGAGFGGMEAARALRHAPVEVTLVDRHNHHLFQPLLYQVATAALSPGDIAWPIRAIFRRQPNVTVLMAEVSGIDTAARQVRTQDGLRLPYDALVVATGATHSYFGHDEWAGVAPGLKTLDDATALRRRLLVAFEQAELTMDATERQRLLTFIVIGAGPTGVELAGAMAELARDAMSREFRRIRPEMARIILLEAGERVLSTFPEDLGETARRSLEAKGVQVLTGRKVTLCDEAGVTCGEDRFPASTVVWAAGVVASPAAQWLGVQPGRAGRLEVGPDLSLPGLPEVFAVGDLVQAKDAEGKPVPGTAPAAKQMGRHVGRLLAARAAGRTAPGAFRYRHQGELATIGRRSAVVALGRFRLTGLIGWWFWGIAHVYFLVGFRSRVVVSFEWLWSYLTFQRGARLITAPSRRPPSDAPV
ncbi:NAD(P)/FAD-dependent oxidoreductase [Roseomonas frigidaquae]|uniref:NADH:ubiquinone reductase (non-electrogenic) n=1 Tax=Falsiroseomonas frigidaquae TaxID=487318 RepID=A0ABX1EUH8_9PROT|nr:NAD(P)/FAD-dependent oxidoreductase [Falsiroseomonas frigidaquae]NKE44291.1 NAD(P)/FAD-dependent oxidoreductase [Falsiroseomonas frigidaquae]